MLDIYICEDNKKQLSLFTGYIRDALLIENLDMQIVLASSDPDEILEGMKASSNMGVFFLDIDLKSRRSGNCSPGASSYSSHPTQKWDF